MEKTNNDWMPEIGQTAMAIWVDEDEILMDTAVEVSAYRGDKAWVTCCGLDKVFRLSDIKFRPIKTEAEKQRDDLLSKMGVDGFQGINFAIQTRAELTICNRLLDAGWIKPKPEPKLEWSATLVNGGQFKYQDAEKACLELGKGWRLPTRHELEGILDLSRHGPAIDTDKFPDTKNGAYWTSTPAVCKPSAAWFVDFGSGFVSERHRSVRACVRAVREVSP